MNTFDKWDDDNVNIKTNLLRGIYANGFEKPSPIQAKGISPMIQKKDIIAQAQSGTGKTGCFCIGLLFTVCFIKWHIFNTKVSFNIKFMAKFIRFCNWF